MIRKNKNDSDSVLCDISCCGIRCPDYDKDCQDVNDHFLCYMGCQIVTPNGIDVIQEQAKGYCPFIHHNN